jgi:hypothetical protein
LRIKVGWCWLLCNVTSPRAPFGTIAAASLNLRPNDTRPRAHESMHRTTQAAHAVQPLQSSSAPAPSMPNPKSSVSSALGPFGPP